MFEDTVTPYVRLIQIGWGVTALGLIVTLWGGQGLIVVGTLLCAAGWLGSKFDAVRS